MELHQIRKLLHSKGNNYQSEKTVYRTRENLWQLLIQQGINIQNAELKKVNTKRINKRPI
jgi:hypothetical protein